jgi:hypothetical protein
MPAMLMALLIGIFGSQASAAARDREPPDEPPLVAPAPKQEGDPFTWLERQVAVGNWVLDAGLGIGSGALGTINEALLHAWRTFAGSLGEGSCGGSFNFVLCTPPDLFLGRDSAIGSVIRTLWSVLRPVALSLVALLFVVRIGRVIAEGGATLAAEGRPLVVSLVTALAFIQGAEQILGTMLAAVNELHRLILSAAAAELMARALQPTPDLNFGAQFTMTVMLLVALALVIKALGRAVHLTMLIGVAPLMGALLLDRSTSPRFTAWLAKLIDVLLQQTTWVFFFWFGTLFFSGTLQLSEADAAGRIAGYAAATAVFGMALTSEAALAGIAGASVSAGMFRGLGQTLVVRSTMRSAQRALHAAGTRGASIGAGALERLHQPRIVSGDPAQSAAHRRTARPESATGTTPQIGRPAQLPEAGNRLRITAARTRLQMTPPAVYQPRALRYTTLAAPPDRPRTNPIARQATNEHPVGHQGGAAPAMTPLRQTARRPSPTVVGQAHVSRYRRRGDA